MDIRSANGAALFLEDLCELGKDFRFLAKPLELCSSAPSRQAPHILGAPADVLDRTRWAVALLVGLENDMFSLEKEKTSPVSSAAMVDAAATAAVVRLLYKYIEDEITAASDAVRQQEGDEQQRCVLEYVSTLMSFVRGIARAQLYHGKERYRYLDEE
jgi:hypothetical protein